MCLGMDFFKFILHRFVQLHESIVLFLFPNLSIFGHYFFEYIFNFTFSPLFLGSSGTNIRSFAVILWVHEAVLLFCFFGPFFFVVLILYCVPSILLLRPFKELFFAEIFFSICPNMFVIAY